MGRQPLAYMGLNFRFKGIVPLAPRMKHDEGLHRLRADGVGHAYYGGHGHCRVGDETIFDLARADAVTAAGDDVVVSAHEPDVTVVVLAPLISGETPVADKLFGRGIGVVPIL